MTVTDQKIIDLLERDDVWQANNKTTLREMVDDLITRFKEADDLLMEVLK
jgi:hypothetical protein